MEHIRCLLERQGNKRVSHGENRTTEHREHSQWKKTVLVWSSDTDHGPPSHTTASTVLGGSGFQEGTRPAKDKLKRHSQEGSIKNVTHLGRGGGSIPQQTWTTSNWRLHLKSRSAHWTFRIIVNRIAAWLRTTVFAIRAPQISTCGWGTCWKWSTWDFYSAMQSTVSGNNTSESQSTALTAPPTQWH